MGRLRPARFPLPDQVKRGMLSLMDLIHCDVESQNYFQEDRHEKKITYPVFGPAL